MKHNLHNILKNLMQKISVSFQVPVSTQKALQKVYQKEKLIIVDVGATGGVEKRWRPIESFCHFITFDPDSRAENLEENSTNFPMGLWSKKETKILKLAAFQPASTVFPFHKQNLAAFLNAPCHEIVSSQEIKLDTLENVLENRFQPDFIKIDAEGADLEILKGAEKFLKTSCLGMQVEAPFYERHERAPFFSDIDIYLRDKGFVLLDLTRERWIRKNNLHSPLSRPQVIWANAVYMLSLETFFERFANFSFFQKELLFAKFLTLLLVYQIHDLAEELRLKAFQKEWIGPELNDLALKAVRQAMPSKGFYFSGLLWNSFLGLAGAGLLFWHKAMRKQCLAFCQAQLHQMAAGLTGCLRTGPYKSGLSDEA